MKTVAIIGGGAAGMMAAVCCAERLVEIWGDAKVVLLERNDKLGAKVMLSGGGRCNLTTGLLDVKKVLENYPRGAKFLMGAMFAFSPQKAREWFEEKGIELKVESDSRVFPVSDNGKEVVAMFEKELERLGVEVRFKSAVSRITGGVANGVAGAGAEGTKVFKIEFEGGGQIVVDAVIVASGGNAFSFTGSKGDGYGFARSFGHTIVPLAPSLSSFAVSDDFISRLAGVSFPKVVLTFEGVGGAGAGATVDVVGADSHKSSGAGVVGERKPVSYQRTGGFVFTHAGISGPAVFALSSMAAYESLDVSPKPKIKINFFPDLKKEDLKKKIQLMTEHAGKKTVVNFLDMLLPKSLSEVIVWKLGFDPTLRAADLSREQREKLVEQLSAFDLTVKSKSSGDEFVTAGGVDTDEVDASTMQSKLRRGLFFAGEVLNVDAFTGGFNLQSAWATGKMAGVKAAEYVSSY
jgi:predicted flavoprotein YhiN